MNEEDLPFLCVDCDVLTLDEYYMVKHPLWKKAGMAPHGGMLCVGCLERRLGRKLRPRDFLRCPLNERIQPGFQTYRSPRLLSRLGYL